MICWPCNRLRALAITDSERSPRFANIPTFAEAGFPKVVVLNWQGIVAPKGTPKAIIDKLNATVNQILAEKDIVEAIAAQSNVIGGGTTADFAALIKSESVKWSALVREAGIKPE